MNQLWSRLRSTLFVLLLAGAATAPAHAQFVTQGEVLAAQRAAQNAERTAAALLSQAAQAASRASELRARAVSLPPRARQSLLAQANYWSFVAESLRDAARFWQRLAVQANNIYQALLRRFQQTTCRLLPNLPLCSVSRN